MRILLFLIAVIAPYLTLSNCTTSVIAVEKLICGACISLSVSELRLIAVIAVTYIYIYLSQLYICNNELKIERIKNGYSQKR